MAVVSVTNGFRSLLFLTESALNFRHISSSRFNKTPFGKFNWIGKKFTATTSENVQDKPPEGNEGEKLSEAEKKLKSDIENLNKELEAATNKAATFEDKYKRSLAEGENLRLRLTKQIEDAKLFGIQSFCKDLLEVSDILQRATESVPKEEITDKNPHLKNLFEGLTMTEAQLQNVFRRHGLVPVNPLNEKFDPNLHEALFQQEVEGKEAGTIVVVSKIGYKLHERVIRPALVGIAKSPS
ncbi:grpe protein, putative [Pediculus humanus corporis]|uniref:GrpE protein homolog n=1 Tax=Pediculus humanus subsp. corporis TaxID=121224 RepID=E0VIG9_PEDHC|nr:grpe protein, putative [Pediculus humanus corporis]EEB13175.1 grpe protein, putative [Pediculus humanus corporis]